MSRALNTKGSQTDNPVGTVTLMIIYGATSDDSADMLTTLCIPMHSAHVINMRPIYIRMRRCRREKYQDISNYYADVGP